MGPVTPSWDIYKLLSRGVSHLHAHHESCDLAVMPTPLLGWDQRFPPDAHFSRSMPTHG